MKPFETGPPKPILRNTLVCPFSMKLTMSKVDVHSVGECRDDAIYLVDEDGNVHYYHYLGKNLFNSVEGPLALGEEE